VKKVFVLLAVLMLASSSAFATNNGNGNECQGNSCSNNGGEGGQGGGGGNANNSTIDTNTNTNTATATGGTGLSVIGFGNKVLSPTAEADANSVNVNKNKQSQHQGQVQVQSADNNGNNWNYTNVQPDHLKTTGVAPSVQGNTTAPCRIQIGASAGWMGGSFGAGSSILDEGCDTGRDIEIIKAMPGLSDAERNLAAVARACDKPTLAKALGDKCPKPAPEVQRVSAIRSNNGVVTSKQY
jgi:hypothetical protein